LYIIRLLYLIDYKKATFRKIKVNQIEAILFMPLPEYQKYMKIGVFPIFSYPYRNKIYTFATIENAAIELS